MRRFFNIKTTLAGLGAAIGYLFSTQNPYDKVNIGTAICMLLTGFFAKDVTPVEVDSRPINPPKIHANFFLGMV